MVDAPEAFLGQHRERSKVVTYSAVSLLQTYALGYSRKYGAQFVEIG
jgi:hypothetical protein